MTSQVDERAKAMRRQRAERAIKLAMESKWEDAAKENEAIIAVFPRDTDAHNRLGKAMTELGRYPEARAAYGRALQLDSNNAIAKKNLLRLESLGQVGPLPAESRQKVDADLFIEETGKTGVTQLLNPTRNLLQHMTAGDKITLKRQGNGLVVESPSGDYLGLVEAKLALRLTRLMDSGNEYASAIAAVAPAGEQARIIIKETRQSPENVGRVSFPTTGLDAVRPYTKESLLRYDLEDDETEEPETEGDEWETEPDVGDNAEIRFSDYERSSESDDDSNDYDE